MNLDFTTAIKGGEHIITRYKLSQVQKWSAGFLKHNFKI